MKVLDSSHVYRGLQNLSYNLKLPVHPTLKQPSLNSINNMIVINVNVTLSNLTLANTNSLISEMVKDCQTSRGVGLGGTERCKRLQVETDILKEIVLTSSTYQIWIRLNRITCTTKLENFTSSSEIKTSESTFLTA